MKFSLDRLKNTDWKQVGVNHGEKIALAGVGLLVVLILFVGTRWKTYDAKEPKDLTDDVQKQSEVLAAATWPEEEQKKYTASYDVNEVYKNTYSVVHADPFKYPIGHSMIFALHRRQEPISEPNWLPVEDLIVTSGRFILQLPPEGQEAIMDGALALADDTGDGTAATGRDAAKLAEFAVPNAQGGMGPEGGIGFGNPGGVPMPMGAGEFPGGEFDPMGGINSPTGEGMEMGMGEMGTQINARGVRYNAVRGIFPFRKQAEAIANARHDVTFANPRQYVNILDFEIQRQTAKPGPNPWSNDDADWETLDQTVALDLLAEASNYAEYVVDYSHLHYVITSPLPARLVGNWHPYFIGHEPSKKIKTYNQRQLELRRLLNEQLVRMEKEFKEMETEAPGGFSLAQRNMSGLQNEVAGDVNSQRQLFRSMERMLNPNGEEGVQLPTAELQGMLNATSQMPDHLLFRYMDFDVEPGKAYRYRVKLKMKNPNYGELADNLAAENVGTGMFRYTPWSEPSDPSIVTDDSRYFVVDTDPGSSRKEPSAKIDLYQWVSEIGTTANKVVSVQAGQIIGQPKPPVDEDGELLNPDDELLVDVLRPYQSFEPEPVELATRDAVVDFVTPPGVRRSDFHSDIGIREWKPVSQVLVVNEFGELENRNPISQLKDRALAMKYLEAEYTPWEYLKQLGQQQDMEGMMGEEGMYDPSGMGDIMDLESYGGGRQPQGRRGRGGAARGPGMGMPGGAGRTNPLRRNRSGV